MLTFSINTVQAVDEYAQAVWKVIQGNLGYFKKFNRDRWQEAVQNAYLYALEHRNENYELDELLPYIKVLARHILKEKNRDIAFGLNTDTGDLPPVFTRLCDYLDETNIEASQELVSAFQEIYLLDPESFMKLEQLFTYDDITDIRDLKRIRIQNSEFVENFRRIVYTYGTATTFKELYEFFQLLPGLIAERPNTTIRELTIRPSNFTLLTKISDEPLIKDEHGNLHKINKQTLSMGKNPDYFTWGLKNPSSCDILKIDLLPAINFLYEEVFVPMGVQTRHILWCGEQYRLTTLGGEEYINLDKEKFIAYSRIELILALLQVNIGTIVALSPDAVYIKVTRNFTIDTFRMRTHYGKVIDLPISVHQKNCR